MCKFESYYINLENPHNELLLHTPSLRYYLTMRLFKLTISTVELNRPSLQTPFLTQLGHDIPDLQTQFLQTLSPKDSSTPIPIPTQIFPNPLLIPPANPYSLATRPIPRIPLSTPPIRIHSIIPTLPRTILINILWLNIPTIRQTFMGNLKRKPRSC